MQKFQKILFALMLLTFSGSLAYAQKSSKPASSSKPSVSPSKPSSRPPAVRPNAQTSKPTPEVKKPSSRPNQTTAEKAKTNETIRKNVETKTSVSTKSQAIEIKKPASFRPNQTVTETDKTVQSSSNSTKPTAKFNSAANLATKKQESEKKFLAATTSKSEYKTSNGQTVAIKSDDVGVKTIRKNLDPDRYATRSTRVEHHYHNHYGSRYDYYRTQPYVYVGGGYDSIFWYAMMDWSLERRALWMYNHQNTINQQLYAQQLANNAQLRAQIETLQLRGQSVNSDYVDPEFVAEPDVMYSDDYVNAAYNPEPVAVQSPQSSDSGSFWIVFTMALLFFISLTIYFVFIHDWKF
jgi:hypothetical protein